MSSKEIFEESKKYMPGGVNSPVRAYRDMGIDPPVMKSAKGVIIKDEDGKEYIDFVLAWGPMLLGHCNEEVVKAIKEISVISKPSGSTKCSFAPAIAHVLAIFPVFCGISGSTITIFIFTFSYLLLFNY